MEITRRFTREGQDPFAGLNFAPRSSVIRNPNGSVVFERMLNSACPWRNHMNDLAVFLAAVVSFPPDEEEEFARQLPALLPRLPAEIAGLICQRFLSSGQRTELARDAELSPTVEDRTLTAFRAHARGLRELLQPAHAAD